MSISRWIIPFWWIKSRLWPSRGARKGWEAMCMQRRWWVSPFRWFCSLNRLPVSRVLQSQLLFRELLFPQSLSPNSPYTLSSRIETGCTLHPWLEAFLSWRTKFVIMNSTSYTSAGPSFTKLSANGSSSSTFQWHFFTFFWALKGDILQVQSGSWTSSGL